MKTRHTLLTMILAILGCHANAQTPALKKPEDAIKAYFSDLQTEGMRAVSRHIHSEELARFKSMLMPWFRKDATNKSEAIKGLFGPDATLASVEGASATEFMDAFMHFAGEQLKDAQIGDAQILGSVQENDVLHFVTRSDVSVKGVRLKSMEVVSLRAEGSDWKLMLSGNLEGLAAAIAAQP
jgi:hypothetical protein